MRYWEFRYLRTVIVTAAVYCTADIEVNDAKLTAENSEAVCIEGLNSLSLTGCDLSGHIQENEQNDCDWTVILYQSMSGDSEVGNAVFNMTGGSLTSENGGLFYTTNTESTFYLNNVNITPSSNNEFFLKCHIDFSGMPLLESIRFSSVQQIDPSDFKNLSGLKRLIILESNLSDLNWLKDAAYNLNYLDIAGEIENCEGVVSQTNLETLCLRHHIIHDITPIKKLRNLKTLDMRYMNGDNAETLHWLGIENVIVSKRDVAIDDIKRKVEDLNRNAVSRLRSKERSLSNVELPRIQRTMLLREMQRPFERLIKNYIKANYEDKLERLQAGEYYMNSYLPKDEYIAIFKEKALQEYPFLAYEL